MTAGPEDSGTANSAFEDCLDASSWVPDGPASPFESSSND